MKINYNSILKVLVLFSLVTLISCKKKQTTDPGTAQVKFINTVATSNSQNIYQGNVKLNELPIEYGETSEYLKVIAGYSTLWTKDEYSNQRVSISDVLLYNDVKYSLFMYKTKDDFSMLAGYINQKQTVGTGKFSVRFLNLSTAFNDKALDVNDRNGDGISRGLKFGDNPVYIQLPTNTEFRVNVIDDGNITAIPASTFESGKTYFVWFDTYDGSTVNYHVILED